MKIRALFAIAIVWLIVFSLRGATLTVTNTADSGPGSLRDVLALAADGDTIDAMGVSGSILLTNGELLVQHSVSIVGPGPDVLAVDGNSAGPAFHVTNGVTVTISKLSITNGIPGIFNEASTVTVNYCTLRGNGSGIYNTHGTMTVSNSVISGNSTGGFGGGILNNAESGGDASLNIACSTLNDNWSSGGGAIFSIAGETNRATVLIIDSVVRGNRASGFGGGGIYNRGFGPSGVATLTIVNSTISSNSANTGPGGGIWSGGTDGGCGRLTILKSTLSENLEASFGGGVLNVGFAGGGSATLLIAESTVSRNSALSGGGIYNIGEYSGSARLQVIKSTLSGNLAPEGSSILNRMLPDGLPSTATMEIGSTIVQASNPDNTITNDSGTATSLGYNLSSGDGGGVLNNATDLINTDPLLGPLQDNGGPAFTHALLPGSPAIDHGFNFSSSDTDQRGTGFVRTVDDPSIPNALGGDGTDIGAYEVQPPAAPPDSDRDGVPDSQDECPNTPAGDIVDANGCSIDQLVPCGGPAAGGTWKNHGEYVSAIARTAASFVAKGRINERQLEAIVKTAASSHCGRR